MTKQYKGKFQADSDYFKKTGTRPDTSAVKGWYQVTKAGIGRSGAITGTRSTRNPNLPGKLTNRFQPKRKIK